MFIVYFMQLASLMPKKHYTFLYQIKKYGMAHD